MCLFNQIDLQHLHMIICIYAYVTLINKDYVCVNRSTEEKYFMNEQIAVLVVNNE